MNTIKLHNCETCKRGFSQKSYLTQHTNDVHLKLKPHTCDTCKRGFSQKVNLTNHINNVHLKLRPYKCGVCKKVFSQKVDLKTHTNSVHLKLKPYNCEICDIYFSQKVNLNSHINAVHLKLRPFKCEICNMYFNQNTHLTNHINTVHKKIKLFECNKCTIKFNTQYKLTKHIKVCTGFLKCSTGEKVIMRVLTDMGLTYDFNETFEVKNIKLLIWDFIIHIDNTKLFIEYNGPHHTKVINFGKCSKQQSEDNLLLQIKKDKIKTDYCKDNNYKLLWISYTDFGRINELVADFIINNSTWGYETPETLTSYI